MTEGYERIRAAFNDAELPEFVSLGDFLAREAVTSPQVLDESVTAMEAAELLGVSSVTIRQWRRRGHLEPVPGTTPQTFSLRDLARVSAQTRQRAMGRSRRA